MLKKISLAVIIALSATASMAAEPAAFAYVGGDVGSTKFDGISGQKTSYGIFGGYQFNQNIAVELGYRRLGSLDYLGASGDANQTSLAVLPIAPLGNDFSIYGRLGYGHNSVDVSFGGRSASGSTSGGIYGIGLGYNFTPTVFGRAEILRAASDTNNFSLSVGFKF